MLPSNKQHVAGNKQLVARNMLLVACNKLLVRATCCAVARNLLRWCKRGISLADVA